MTTLTLGKVKHFVWIMKQSRNAKLWRSSKSHSRLFCTELCRAVVNSDCVRLYHNLGELKSINTKGIATYYRVFVVNALLKRN